jgi:hypothetical protein
MAGIEVLGLKQAQDNFNKLLILGKTDIGRQSLHAMGWTVAKPMKAETYTTFKRETGAIQTALAAGVEHEAKGEVMRGWVKEFPQTIAGTSPQAALFRSHFKLKGRRPSKKAGGGGPRIDTSAAPFWWRFLEFGTGPRRTVATPRFLRTGKIAHKGKGQARQLKSALRWQASPSHGGIKSRAWLRPTFSGNAHNAINSFRETFLKLVDAATSAMPKR